MDEAARDAAAAAEEMSAGDGDAPTRSTPPAEEMVSSCRRTSPRSDPVPAAVAAASDTAEDGGVALPAHDEGSGAVRSDVSAPRHVIISRLPPGCSTEPRSDLQNFFTTHIPYLAKVNSRAAEDRGLRRREAGCLRQHEILIQSRTRDRGPPPPPRRLLAPGGHGGREADADSGCA